jgi:RNA polymerase sigma-70 factor (ECF subfamily)
MFGSKTPVGGLSEPELLRLARNGHREAFGELYDRHGVSVRRFSIALTRNESDADDLVQETFLALVQKKTPIEVSGTDFGAYLCGMARNNFLEDLRRKGRRRGLLEEHEPESKTAPARRPDDDLLAKEIQTRVAQALAELPPNQRAAIEDFDLRGFSLKEGAERAGIDPASFKARLNRGRQTLRKLLSFMDQRTE